MLKQVYKVLIEVVRDTNSSYHSGEQGQSSLCAINTGEGKKEELKESRC
jgi:hypothetical protein